MHCGQLSSERGHARSAAQWRYCCKNRHGHTTSTLLPLILRKRRVLPPVSKATGGPMPGVDLTDFSALQESDDLEYVERMKRFK